jgi:hypothetical protein
VNFLDEKGFVFIDAGGRPYQVRMIENQPWLCYWYEHDKRFVTLRPVNQTEIWQFAAHKLPEEQAKLYFQKDDKQDGC